MAGGVESELMSDEMGWDGIRGDGMRWDWMAWDRKGWEGMGLDGIGCDRIRWKGWDGIGGEEGTHLNAQVHAAALDPGPFDRHLKIPSHPRETCDNVLLPPCLPLFTFFCFIDL